MQALYDHAEIVATRTASYFFACTVGIMLVPTMAVFLAREFCTINVVELDQLSTGSSRPYHVLPGME